MERYQRQTVLPEIGVEGQKSLSSARVVVVGAGGLGCPSLAYLAAAGVGFITIVDNDVVEKSNLQRQILFSTHDIGFSKAEMAALQLEAMNPDIQITTVSKRLNAGNAMDILSGYDVILDGTDNFETRYLINDTALKLRIPVVFGALTGFEGQVAVYGGKGACYRCLYPSPPKANIRNCAEAGAVGAVAGIIGSMMALEALKIVLPVHSSLQNLSNRLLIIDGRTMDVQQWPLLKKADCICHKSCK